MILWASKKLLHEFYTLRDTPAELLKGKKKWLNTLHYTRQYDIIELNGNFSQKKSCSLSFTLRAHSVATLSVTYSSTTHRVLVARAKKFVQQNGWVITSTFGVELCSLGLLAFWPSISTIFHDFRRFSTISQRGGSLCGYFAIILPYLVHFFRRNFIFLHATCSSTSFLFFDSTPVRNGTNSLSTTGLYLLLVSAFETVVGIILQSEQNTWERSPTLYLVYAKISYSK